MKVKPTIAEIIDRFDAKPAEKLKVVLATNKRVRFQNAALRRKNKQLRDEIK